MPDRIPCINPRCARTAAQDKFPDSDEIICGKCFRAMPVPMRRRDRQLRKRWQIVERLVDRGDDFRRRGRKFGQPDRGAPQAYTMHAKMQRLWDRHWRGMHAYFTTPHKPIGLDAFLEEVGL